MIIHHYKSPTIIVLTWTILPKRMKQSHFHPISNFNYYCKITHQTFLSSILKQSSLSAWTNHKSVMGAVQVLSARLALLEPAHLDHIEGRLHAVHTRMNSISEKKAAIEDADKQSKVSCYLRLCW